jgi:hypothetical protein
LYLSENAGDRTNAGSVYLAGVTSDNAEKVVFTYDVSRYLEQLESQVTKPSESRVPKALQQGQTLDGCLNTLQLPGGVQGLHLSLFLEDPQSGTSGATDTLFTIQAPTSLQPVLELEGTSLVRTRASRKVAHQDSTIWLRQTSGDVTEVIWEQFNRTFMGIMTADYSLNAVYKWEGNSFHKVGTLQPNQLADHLKGALALKRCGAIIPLRFEVEKLRPNQPAP